MTGVVALGTLVGWSLYAKAPSSGLRVAFGLGMFVPCVLTLLVMLGATIEFTSVTFREDEEAREGAPRAEYVGVALSCFAWYLLGAFVHWACTGPSVNVVAG